MQILMNILQHRLPHTLGSAYALSFEKPICIKTSNDDLFLCMVTSAILRCRRGGNSAAYISQFYIQHILTKANGNNYKLSA